MYDPEILEKWTKEIDLFGKYIDHSRDDKFTFAGLQQLIDKYLVKNQKQG